MECALLIDALHGGKRAALWGCPVRVFGFFTADSEKTDKEQRQRSAGAKKTRRHVVPFPAFGWKAEPGIRDGYHAIRSSS
jgi:hypothetical protein